MLVGILFPIDKLVDEMCLFDNVEIGFNVESIRELTSDNICAQFVVVHGEL